MLTLGCSIKVLALPMNDWEYLHKSNFQKECRFENGIALYKYQNNHQVQVYKITFSELSNISCIVKQICAI